MNDPYYIQADFSEVDLPPGGEATIAVIPREDVHLERIIIPADIARLLEVPLLAIAGATEFDREITAPLPGHLFSEVADAPFKFSRCPARHLIEVRLRNTTQKSLRVSGCQAILRLPERLRPPRALGERPEE